MTSARESKRIKAGANPAPHGTHSDQLALLVRESRFLHALMEHFPDRIYYKDLESRFIYGSRSFVEFFQVADINEVYGKTDADYFSAAHAQAAREDEQEIIRSGQPKLNMEEQETWPDGRVTWCSTTKVPFLDDQGEVIGTFGISRDITLRKQAQEALRESEARYRQVSEQLAEANRNLQDLILTDPLTGLRNRRFLTTRMPEDIAQVERAHRMVAGASMERIAQNVDLVFLMVDLDHFKAVNDTYGHVAGDQVLQQVGEVLRNAARTTDTVARVGGEEFLVVARQTAGSDSLVVAERIRSMVEAHPFRINGGETLHCTCSVGFSVYPLLLDDTRCFNWEQVVEVADHCLYEAKRGGRNGWVGLLPGHGGSGRKDQRMPETIAELVRTGILPLVSSLTAPVAWEAARSRT